jgi:hypothetical protein
MTRKPRPLETKHLDFDIHTHEGDVWVSCDVFNLWGKDEPTILRNLRALNRWTARAVAWLEARREKETP